MEGTELERRCAALKARCAKLAAEDQERVLDAWAQVLALCELPREPGETMSLSISLDRSSEITHLSG
jgi:hypothetical protein